MRTIPDPETLEILAHLAEPEVVPEDVRDGGENRARRDRLFSP